MEKTIHQGRNVKRFREMLGIKQESLAHDLGADWNQKKISLLEGKEQIDEVLLQQVAGVLKVPVEAIKNFDEEQAVNIIANTFHDSAVANTFTQNSQANFNCTFNPIEKWVEAVNKNEELYERLLQVEREKNELLQQLLDSKK
ncbi:helix-turn-helix domain-containing protein [Ferruginibacter profundus]